MIDERTKEILNKDNYTNPIRYISGNIIEYDIKAANITMMLVANKIDEGYYNYLFNLPKSIREKEVGLAILKDPNINTLIKSGIRECKVLLGEKNNIVENEIVRIANDAVYINRSVPFKYTTFGKIFFKTSNPINVYLKLLDLVIFITIPLDNSNMIIDVKGIDDSNLYLFNNTMLQIIGTVVFMIERSSVEDALNYLSDIINKYVNKELDIEFYREFNAGCFIKISNNSGSYGLLQSNGIDINIVDINYNLYVLRELWSIILEIYNRR